MSLGGRASLLIGVAVLVVVVRLVGTGTSEFRQARAHEGQGHWHEAAVHYGRAIRAYLPLSPLPRRAADGLAALAQRAEAEGDALEARYCWEELRSSFLAVRSTYQPGKRYIEEAQARLVPLMLTDERATWPDRSLPPEQRAAILRTALERREDPKLGWVLVMGAGYVAWLGGAALAILRGLPREEDAPVRWPELSRWAAVSAVGYGAWLLGVGLA